MLNNGGQDHAFDEAFLCALDDLLHKLPLADRKKKAALVGANNDRSYYCDAEGWIRATMADAITRAFQPADATGAPLRRGLKGDAMLYMRFLLYAILWRYAIATRQPCLS